MSNAIAPAALVFAAALVSATGARAAPFAYVFGEQQRDVLSTGAVDSWLIRGGYTGPFGYAVVRVLLKNTSDEPVTATITFNSSDRGTVTKPVALGGREERRVSLSIPTGLPHGVVSVSAPRTSGTQTAYLDPRSSLAWVIGSATEFQELVGTPPDSSGTTSAWVNTREPDDLPEELAAYVSLSAVVVPGRRLGSLPAPVQRVLEAYVLSGGNLVLADGSGAAQAMRQLATETAGEHRYGFGSVFICPAESDCRLPIMTAVHRGPGAAQPGSSHTQDLTAGGAVHPAAALLPQARPPVGQFLGIIILFAAVVGPGSVLVARRKGPAALLVTVPATGLVTCVLIVAYTVLIEGATLHATVRAITLLDRAENRATTVGVVAFYANRAHRLPPLDAFTTLFPSEGPLSVHWGKRAELGTDAVPARTYRELGVAAVYPSRARLVVSETNGGLRVRNALGATVRTGLVHVGGKSWLFRDLADGQEGLASHAASSTSDVVPPELLSDARAARAALHADVSAALRDGEFVATVEGAGPLSLIHSSAELNRPEHLIRGQVDR